MKRIRKSRATRILSWLMSVVMITPLLSGLITPSTAMAMGGQQAATTVAVLDFVNRTNDPLGTLLAQQASAAVAVELGNTQRYEVLPRKAVIDKINELQLHPPFDQIAKTRLAQELGVQQLVDGEVVAVRDDIKASPRTLRVAVKVRVSEPSSGDLLSGAAVVGEARSRPGQSDRDSLAQEAVTNAAVVSVRQILATNLPEGVILSSVGDQGSLQVLINQGSRDGVKEGMELIVLRDRQRVGRLKVTTVYPTDSECKVLDNTLGLRPQDKVRAVFPMPEVDTQGMVTRAPQNHSSSSAMGTLGKILLVLVVGIVIATAIKGGTSTTTGVTAEADIVNFAPAVQLIWRDTIFGGSIQTLEYHVWRTPGSPFNFADTPVAALGPGTHNYTDFPAPGSFWNGTNQFIQGNPPGSNTGGNGGNGGGTVTAVTPAQGAVLGFNPNTTYTYQITSIIQRPLPESTGGGGGGGGGQGGGFEVVESNAMSSGPTTPIPMPFLATPADATSNVSLASATLSWQSVSNADQFAIEFSTDRTFKNRNLIAHREVFSTAPNASGVPQTFTVDLTSDPNLKRDTTFANFVNRVPGAPRPVIFWRIGARNSQDQPGPVDWITRNPKTQDKTFRFIYSLVRSFSPADMPPPPPGG